jgi:hypothetical protein
MWVVAAMAACGDAKIEKLEKRVIDLETETAKLRDHTNADYYKLQNMIVNGPAGGSGDDAPVDRERFYDTVRDINGSVGGLDDRTARIEGLLKQSRLDGANTGWWCTRAGDRCGRTRFECENTIGKMLSAELERMPSDCARQDTAWCDEWGHTCASRPCKDCVETR